MQFTTPRQIIRHTMDCPNELNEEGTRQFISEIVDVMKERELDWLKNILLSNFYSKYSEQNEEPYFEYQKYCEDEKEVIKK